MISFDESPHIGKEIEYMQEAIRSRRISGDGLFTKNAMNGWKISFSPKK